MSTRGVIGFLIDGQQKLAYNHFDSYPSGKGCEILEWLSAQLRTGSEISLREHVRAIKFIDNEDRDCEQGTLAWYIEHRVMPDERGFAEDSLWCEWGWIINFDDRTLDAYKGFQHVVPTDGLWAGSQKCYVAAVGSSIYPINRVHQFSFDALPDCEAFLAVLEPDEE